MSNRYRALWISGVHLGSRDGLAQINLVARVRGDVKSLASQLPWNI